MRSFVLMLFLVCPYAAGSDPMGDLPRLLPAQPPAPKENPTPKDWQPGVYSGRVVGLTEKAVIIKLAGALRVERISFHPDGTVKEKQVYTQDNDQPPKEFVFHDQLLPRPGGRTLVVHGHNISDLRIGDVIQFGCSHGLDMEYCTSIEIHRRPGGRVPRRLEMSGRVNSVDSSARISTTTGGTCG
jgi:hypothetical protein